MRRGLLLLALLPASATAETPDEIAAILSKGDRQVAAMIAAHPEWKTAWAEDFWADALLRAPRIPGTRWRVHDLRRPQPPRVVPPMRECRGVRPPRGAVALFSGRSTTAFVGDRLPDWSVEGGALVAGARQPNRIATRRSFGDLELHLEYREPDPPRGVWQYRGNSGVFLMGRYEIQILDSYGSPTYPDGQTGALYGQAPPAFNAALAPGRWQCLDIVFTAPRFVHGTLRSPARVSVRHNGILVQDRARFLGPTAFAEIERYVPHPRMLPLALQDHGDGTSRVAFRNIWVLPRERGDGHQARPLSAAWRNQATR